MRFYYHVYPLENPDTNFAWNYEVLIGFVGDDLWFIVVKYFDVYSSENPNTNFVCHYIYGGITKFPCKMKLLFRDVFLDIVTNQVFFFFFFAD